MALRVIFLGDIVGKPGRRVVQQRLADLRRLHQPDLIVANAENVAGGSGITPQLYRKLIGYGLDGLTLGDHAFRQREILGTLDQVDDLIRPANFPDKASGCGSMVLSPGEGRPSLHVITVLGRVFMPPPVAGDPFEAVDRLLAQVGEDAQVIVEIHAETTSEKAAAGHYFDGKVAAVVGTHTHVPTADARILPGGTAFITDLGMCGPYDSVIGRRKDRVVQFMTSAMPAAFDVASGDVRLCGVLVEIDDVGRASRCERIEMAADMERPPFGENT